MTSGIALTIACGTSLLLISACGPATRRIAGYIFLLPVLVGVWSLAAAPVTYFKAKHIAGDRPYCIGAHSHVEEELISLFALRGLNFYTTRSGYKFNSSWYFHGVLLVYQEDGLEVYNWSPRAMRFDKVEKPDLLLVRPTLSCQPRNDFLRNLSVI
ncbi:MAG: hypothetical protein ABJ327_05710 [Litoreibacter sp.]